MNSLIRPAIHRVKSIQATAESAAQLVLLSLQNSLRLSGVERFLLPLLLMMMVCAGAHAELSPPYTTTFITKDKGTPAQRSGLQIVRYSGTGGNVMIPGHLVGPDIQPSPPVPVQDYPVIDIGANAFMWTPYTFDVTFEVPNGLTDIGPSAFAYCTGLTSVALPTSGTMIGSSAFTYCTALPTITIPSSYGRVNESAFSTCTALANISLPTGLVLGSAAFQYCTALPSVTIPAGTWIGDLVFNTCTGLKRVTINDGAKYIGDGAFQNCSALQTWNDLPPPNNARPLGDLIFPDSLRGIGGSAFDSCNRLTKITIPPYLYFIGPGAFSNCNHLTNITVSYHVSNIGDGGISDCPALTNVVLPNSITYIGDSAFKNCPLLKYSTGTNNFTIPNSVTDIGPSAFSGCNSLTTIDIPESVSCIWNSAFANCAGLSSVTIANGVTDIWDSAFSGCAGLASVTIGTGVTQVGAGAFAGCTGLTTVLFMGDGPTPDTGAFDQPNLTLYYLAGASWWNPTFDGLPTAPWPGPVKGLTPNHGPAVGGFQVVLIGTNFTTATAVRFGGVDASFHVDSATQITAVAPAGSPAQPVDVSVVTPLGTTINTAADQFTYDNPVLAVTGMTPSHSSAAGAINVVIRGSFFTGATSVMFGSTPATSFHVDSATQITAVAPAGVEGQKADVIVTTPLATSANTAADDFIYETVNYTYTVSNGAVTITGYTGAVGDVVIPASVNGLPVSSIAASGFENCYGLTGITIPNSVTIIGDRAFKNCYGLTSISLPNSVTSIGVSAFENCTGLLSATLPDGVTSIGDLAFSGCTGLTGVTLGNYLKSIGAGAFKNCDGLQEFKVPNSVTSIGDSAFFGCTGLTRFTIGTNVTSIGARAFQNCDGLTGITLPNNLASIGANAFTSCNGLTTLTIPNKVASIGGDAFSNCNRLTSIIISNGITKVWDSALSNCPVLASVIIPSSVTQIGNSAFTNCPALNNVIIPNSVTDIGVNAFTNCTGLINLRIGNGVTNIGISAFSGCTALSRLTIPDSVTRIGDSAFSGCTGLLNVLIGNGVTNIGETAFSGCTGLGILTIGNGVTSIGTSAFAGCASLTRVLFLGACPSPDSPVFTKRNLTLYYLTGAAGWASKFDGTATIDGLTTAQWPGPIIELTPNHGSSAGGTSVIITGTHFTGTTAVWFGTTPAASFTVDSAMQITALTPAGTAGEKVDVSVTTPGGRLANTSVDDFTYDYLAPAVSGLSPTHGPAAGGASVVISGDNFTDVRAVKFGTAAAVSFTVNSSTQITAVAPAGAVGQKVNVSVTTPGGTTANTAADDFTYDVLFPTVTGLNLTHGPAAGGTRVVIRGANFNGATAVNFGTATAASFTLNSATQITAVAPAGGSGQQVDVSVTTPNGTSVNTAADDFTYEISGPTVTGLTPTHGSADGGTSVVILGADFNGATAVRFGTAAAASFTVDSGSQITAVAPAGTVGHQVDVSVTTPGGTSAFTAWDKFIYSGPESIAPKIVVLEPRSKNVAQTFAVGGIATDNQGIDRVEVTLNGGPARLAALNPFISGTASFTLGGVTPENGKNTVMVQAIDLQGNKSAPVTVVVNYVNTRPQFAGAYTGLLVSGSGVAPSNNLSGLVKLTVTSAGSFSGNITLGGFVLPIAGLFGNDGVAHFKPTMAASLTLIGKATPPRTLGDLALTLDTVGSSDKITGALKEANGSTLADIDTDRAVFSKLNTVDAKFLKNKGFYTVVFAGKGQQGSPATSTHPQGDGFGSVTVTAKGIATLKGTLADGTIVSAAAPLSKTYHWPCYAQLYSKGGSIAGDVSFDGSNPVTEIKGIDLLWFRPAIVTSKYYPAGWVGGITVDLLGSEYSVPAKPPIAPATSVFPGLKAIDLANGNAALEFSDGKLPDTNNPLNKNLNIDPLNKVTNIITSNVIDKSFSLKLTPTTGRIGGFFTHLDGISTAFKGVILQNDVNAGDYILKASGYGFFLSTPPRVLGGVGESGGVSLFAK